MPRGFRSRGCKGRSPLHKKTKNLPRPAGKGVGGMGERKQAKGRIDRRQRRHPPCGCRIGRVDRRQRRQAPLRVPGRQGQQETNRANPPTGHHNGRVSRRPSPCAPPQAPLTPAEPMPRGFRSRGCKGRSPLHKKTKNLPLPRRGRGAGGWGRKGKLKAGAAGNKEGKPPLQAPQWRG